jgi:hypothetical protein
MNNYNGSKSAPVNNGGYGHSAEKSDIVTHPIVSLTPYQNKFVSWQIIKFKKHVYQFFSI